MRPIVVACLGLAGACAHVPTIDFRCAAAGGPPWRTVRTENVTLVTDVGPEDAAELARQVERMRALVLSALFRSPPRLPGRLAVVAFRTRNEFEEFAPSGAVAYYARFRDGAAFLVIPARLRWSESGPVLAHEIAHHVAAQVFPTLPRWFAEGLAVFLEPVGQDFPDGTPRVGDVPASRGYDRAPVRTVLAAGGLFQQGEYETSWALVHWMFNRRPREFAGLMQRFARGEEPLAAWRAVFPAYDPEDPERMAALDADLGAFLGARRGAAKEVKATASLAVAQETLSAAEVHALRLRFRTSDGTAPSAGVREELAEGLREDPGQPDLLRLAVAVEKRDALAAGRAAVAAHPRDWRAYDLLGDALPMGGERLRARQEAAALAPDEAIALVSLASDELAAGRTQEALAPAERAARLAPWHPVVQVTLARVALQRGDCAGALLAARRARTVATLERGRDRVGAQVGAELAAIESRCAAPVTR